MGLTALDNVALLETMVSGRLVTTPSPAARAYFGQKRTSAFANPAFNSTFLQNAWIPWQEAFNQPRDWPGYADLIATRTSKFAATSIMVHAQDVPGEVQNNPNDPQNELRLTRYREDYRQATLYQNRDVFTPITVDTLEISRILQDSGPDGTEASTHVNGQITQAVNADRAREFHTLMAAIGRTAAQTGIYNLNLPDLRANGATADQARQAGAALRLMVLALADFVPYFTPAKNTTTVPKEQVRMVIRQSYMQQIGALGYSTSFNPEYVFALPQDQIVELPDHYFDRNLGLVDKYAFIVDRGSDKKVGSLALVDTFHNWGIDNFAIKSSENRALHHAEILDVNPFETFITVGQGVTTAVNLSSIIPATITGGIYGPDGNLNAGANVVRGQQYSTSATVLDTAGLPAGGWIVTVSGNSSSHTLANTYGTVVIGNDETAANVNVIFTSAIDATKTVTYNYIVTGTAVAYDGTGVITGYGSGATAESVVFAAGTGTGGTITYTLATGTTAQISADGGTTYTAAGASPIAVPTGQTRRFRTLASYGYVFANGVGTHNFGPYTAA